MIYGKCADEGDKSVDKLIKYNIEGHHLIILYTFVICIVVVGYIVDPHRLTCTMTFHPTRGL